GPAVRPQGSPADPNSRRRRAGDHAVELSVLDRALGSGHGPGRGQHRGPEARARDHARRPPPRRAVPPGGAPRRRRERGGRGRRGGRGPPARAATDVGPLTLERQRRVVEEHVEDAVARGARVVVGGARGEGPGWFYPPTVLTAVDHTMRIMREETFGPVLPIMTVASVDEALMLANDSDYGLTASGWTRDPETARRLQEGLNAGVVTINDCLYSFGEPTAPWGGVKRSGIGRVHGLAGLLEMTQAKYVSRDTGR